VDDERHGAWAIAQQRCHFVSGSRGAKIREAQREAPKKEGLQALLRVA